MDALISSTFLILLLVLAPAQTSIAEFFPADSKTYEISRRYSHYRLSKRQYSDKLLNTEFLINPYSTCLVHMINYENADLTAFTYPTIQSRYDILEQKFFVFWNVFNNMKILTTSKRFRMLPWTKIPNQNESLAWCKHEWPDFECPDIPFTDKSTKLKSWQCEVHFYLYPPSNPFFYYHRVQVSNAILRLPASFRRQFWSASLERIYGKDIWLAIYRISTSDRHDVLVREKTTPIESWISAFTQQPLGRQETTVSSSQLLSAFTDANWENRWTNKFGLTWKFTLFCRYCHPTELPFSQIPLGHHANRQDLINRIMCLTHSLDHIIHLIIPLGRPPSSSLHARVERFPELKSFHEVNYILNDLELSLDEVRWELETRVLGSVFKNITFATYLFQAVGLLEKFKERQNSETRPPVLAILPNGRLDQFPFSLHEQALKFVSCGEPNLEKLNILRIISIYDNSTWLAVAVSMISISLFTTLTIGYYEKTLKISLWRNLGHIFLKHILSHFALLIENSDSIQLCKYNRLRFLLGSYFLAVIILGNAFKDKNISDLTMPRARLPYDTFESLVANNFSIYTRSVYMGGWANLKNLVSKGSAYGVIISYSIRRFHNFRKSGDFVISEIFSFVHSQEQIRNLWMTTKNFSERNQRLINATKILPYGFKLLEGQEKTCTLFGKNSSCNIFQSCNKTALFLPDVDAHLKYLETVEGNEGKVFLSANSSVKIKFGMLFFDWVHPRVLKRLAGLQESYIMEWWTEYMVDFVPKIKSKHFRASHRLWSTNIHGKILTIFILYFGGFLICVLVYMLECWNTITVKKSFEMVSNLKRTSFKVFNANFNCKFNQKYKSATAKVID